MIKKIRRGDLTMSQAASYRIIVPGVLNPSYTSHLGGMRVSERLSEEGDIETILIGRLPDQAALSGVLNSLYEFHLPVFSVELLDER